jgi:hypothetical protein
MGLPGHFATTRTAVRGSVNPPNLTLTGLVMDSIGTCIQLGGVAVGARNSVPAVRDWCLRLASLAALALTVAQSGAAQDARKVIKDKAEYNTYVKALAMQDPGERAAALEAFLVQYPTSVAVSDALTAALEA